MEPNARIFKMTNAGIFLNEKDMLDYSSTNLPKAHFSFRERSFIYWKVKIIACENQGEFTITVLEYDPKNIHSFASQQLLGHITRFIFEPFEYDKIMKQISSYRPNYLGALFSKRNAQDNLFNDSTFLYDRKRAQFHPRTYLAPIEKTITDTLTIKFAHCTIVDKGITFTSKVKGHTEDINFHIANDYLLNSFDPLKEYISKRTGRKTFTVHATIKTVDWKVAEVHATSEHIAALDEKLFHSLQFARVKPLITATATDKFVLTLPELVQLAGEQHLTTVPSVNDLIAILGEKRNVRNYAILQHLSAQHDADRQVYLTCAPYFGFIFTVLTPTHFAFVWELPDSHATYVWQCDNNTAHSAAAAQLEQQVRSIFEQGRQNYTFGNNQLMQNNIHLTRIDHQFIDEEKKVDFAHWQQQYEALLN